MSFWFQYSIIFLLAIIPAAIWAVIFLRQHKEGRWLVVLTFLGGMLAAKLILIYQGYWDTTLNLIFIKVSFVDFRSNISELIVNGVLSAGVTFLSIGAIEEFAKFWMMKTIGSRFFKSIDDVIMLAIVSALGFAFLENMIYFMGQWGQLSSTTFLLFAMSRVTIVTMVHVLCSGILGYYFGMAFFASPILAMEHRKKKRHPVINFLNRVLHLKKDHMYHDEMLFIGLLLAMVIHALYDFLLFSQVTVKSGMLVLVMLGYFFGGYWYLSRLLKRKELNIKLGLISQTPTLESRPFFFRRSRKESRLGNPQEGAKN